MFHGARLRPLQIRHHGPLVLARLLDAVGTDELAATHDKELLCVATLARRRSRKIARWRPHCNPHPAVTRGVAGLLALALVIVIVIVHWWSEPLRENTSHCAKKLSDVEFGGWVLGVGWLGRCDSV